MSVLNIKCADCKKVFRNIDEIYSFSCGHVFHLGCIQGGLQWSHCDKYSKAECKLYLNFDETATKELELKLKDSYEKIQQLQCQNEEVTRGLQENNRLLEDSEVNFSQLQQQCTEETKELELKFKQLQCQKEEVIKGLQEKNRLLEANFLQLQQQYTETTKELELELKDSVEKIKQLQCQNEEVTRGLQEKNRLLEDSEANFFQLQQQHTETTKELKLELKDSVEQIQQLQCQNEEVTKGLQDKNRLLEDSEANFLQLQQQCTEAIKELELKLKESVEKIQQLQCEQEEVTRGLQEKDRLLEDSEAKFLQLQQQCTEAEENRKELRENIQVLTIENEYKLNEMSLKSIEIETLKTTLEKVECETSAIYLNEKIKILEQKLKYITDEFEKEISNSTKMQIDHMKLKSYIERMELEAEKHESGKKDNENSTQNENSTTAQSGAVGIRLCQSPLNATFISSNAKQGNVMDSTKVFIKNIPSDHIYYPLKNVIINLASYMHLILTQEDLTDVRILEKINLFDVPPNKLTLIVEFRSLDLKSKFLSLYANIKFEVMDLFT